MVTILRLKTMFISKCNIIKQQSSKSRRYIDYSRNNIPKQSHSNASMFIYYVCIRWCQCSQIQFSYSPPGKYNTNAKQYIFVIIKSFYLLLTSISSYKIRRACSLDIVFCIDIWLNRFNDKVQKKIIRVRSGNLRSVYQRNLPIIF